ncbi:MAG TPA: hypothetical protein VK879_09125, partial [Candidatus Sulfomarinibacteraceae bacterium]|nr:hypothetical protein [Candidatus Sulfomarinibacteraceae bacterium]
NGMPPDEVDFPWDEPSVQEPASGYPPPPPAWEDEPAPAATSTASANITNTDQEMTAEATAGDRNGHVQEGASVRNVVVEVDPASDWQQAFRQAVALIGDYPGQDRLALTLRGTDLTMEFPGAATGYCPELEQALKNLSGVVRVAAD